MLVLALCLVDLLTDNRCLKVSFVLIAITVLCIICANRYYLGSILCIPFFVDVYVEFFLFVFIHHNGRTASVVFFISVDHVHHVDWLIETSCVCMCMCVCVCVCVIGS